MLAPVVDVDGFRFVDLAVSAAGSISLGAMKFFTHLYGRPAAKPPFGVGSSLQHSMVHA